MDAADDEYRYEISSACILVLTRCVLILPPARQAVTVPVRSGQVRSYPVREPFPAQNPRAAAH